MNEENRNETIDKNAKLFGQFTTAPIRKLDEVKETAQSIQEEEKTNEPITNTHETENALESQINALQDDIEETEDEQGPPKRKPGRPKRKVKAIHRITAPVVGDQIEIVNIPDNIKKQYNAGAFHRIEIVEETKSRRLQVLVQPTLVKILDQIVKDNKLDSRNDLINTLLKQGIRTLYKDKVK